MADAWIGGKAATLAAAIEEAARLLRASRMPVIAGLGTDIAGARAAIALARNVGAAIDHMHSTTLLRDLDVMREAGMMMTAPSEVRLRADLLLLVGPGLLEAWPDLPARLFVKPTGHDAGASGTRRIIWLCPGRDSVVAGFNIETVGSDPADLPILLASLRARCAVRPAANTTLAAQELDALASQLAQVRFGVAVWSAAEHDVLTIEMLCGLVKDLNAATRFSGLPLAPGDNAAALQQVSGWLTGFPLRTGFGRAYPEHDPWRFDAVRLVDSGEADCALWISAYRAVQPAWTRDLPLIVLTQNPGGFRQLPQVAIAVGCPGIDHDAVEHLAETGSLTWVAASAPSNAISVADAVTQIAAALPAERPC
jgi:formylmethanofuran dehydrogenase subunit B